MRAKLWVLMVTAFVDMLGLVIVLPLLPFYATKMGANATVVGALIAAFSVAQLASAPLWGKFSDKYGRRPALLTGLIISAVAYLIFAMADSLWLLMLSRIVQGFGGGTVGVIQAYVADVSDPKDRAKGLGWLTAATSLGAVVGPAIGSVLIRFFGRNAPGLGAAFLCAAVSVFAWKYLGESHNTSLSSGQVRRSSTSAIWMVLSSPREPAARLIWIYSIAVGAFYGTIPTMPLILDKRLAVDEQTVGFIIMYLGGIGVIVRVWFLGRMADWLGEARLARVGLGLLAIGLSIVGGISSYFSMFVACTLMPIGTAFVFPAVTAALSRVVSAGERGLYMGVQHTFGGISRVAFPLAAGATMDRFGLGIPFYVAGALVGATLLLTMQMESYTEPPVATVKPSIAGGM